MKGSMASHATPEVDGWIRGHETFLGVAITIDPDSRWYRLEWSFEGLLKEHLFMMDLLLMVQKSGKLTS